MNKISFSEWVAHWGKERLDERISESQECYRRMWKSRYESWQFPAFELCLGGYWEEDAAAWHVRWKNCGGRLFENGRMMAAKTDLIWEKLSATFYDGLGNPYPPFARSSCAYWMEVDEDESVVLGVMTEEEVAARRKNSFEKLPPLTEKERAELNDVIASLGGLPSQTREERFLERREQFRISLEESKKAYEARNRERDAEFAGKNAAFNLMGEIEDALAQSPVPDERLMAWMCESIHTLTNTPYFERYPNWRARAWIAAANLHKLQSNILEEAACLEHALTLNCKAPIKRRLKSLKKL